jgi:hypothetical protein
MATTYPGVIAPMPIALRVVGTREVNIFDGTLAPFPKQINGSHDRHTFTGIIAPPPERRLVYGIRKINEFPGINTADFRVINFKRIPRERVLNKLASEGADIR